jgi:hypothetical protein
MIRTAAQRLGLAQRRSGRRVAKQRQNRRRAGDSSLCNCISRGTAFPYLQHSSSPSRWLVYLPGGPRRRGAQLLVWCRVRGDRPRGGRPTSRAASELLRDLHLLSLHVEWGRIFQKVQLMAYIRLWLRRPASLTNGNRYTWDVLEVGDVQRRLSHAVRCSVGPYWRRS